MSGAARQEPAAGRPLDLALAQVMAWQIVVMPDGMVWTTGPSDAPLVKSDGSLVPLPCWSTDEPAVWALIADIRAKTGHEVILWSGEGSRPGWGASVGGATYGAEGVGVTRAEALSRALLRYYSLGIPRSTWRLQLTIIAVKVAIRAAFGIAMVAAIVDPASPQWLRLAAIVGWIAQEVILIVTGRDPARDNLDERAPTAGHVMHLVLISPIGVLAMAVLVGLLLTVGQAMWRLAL